MAPALNAYADTMNPKSRGDMPSAGITNAPNGATIIKSRITANCRKASEATTNFWYGVKRLGDFLSAGGMRATRRDCLNDIGPRGQDLLRRILDPCALDDIGLCHCSYRPQAATQASRG